MKIVIENGTVKFVSFTVEVTKKLLKGYNRIVNEVDETISKHPVFTYNITSYHFYDVQSKDDFVANCVNKGLQYNVITHDMPSEDVMARCKDKKFETIKEANAFIEYSPNVEIDDIKAKLAKTDYKAIKYAEGFISEIDYAQIKSQRQAWRDRITVLGG